MKSLLYVSPLLSQAWNTFIKWWFLFSSGLLLLGVPWAAQFGSPPKWLKYCRLSLWLLARHISWLLDWQFHSAFKVCFLWWQGCGSVHTWGLRSLKLHRGHFRWVRTHHHPAPRDNCWLTTVNTSSNRVVGRRGLMGTPKQPRLLLRLLVVSTNWWWGPIAKDSTYITH